MRWKSVEKVLLTASLQQIECCGTTTLRCNPWGFQMYKMDSFY